MDILKYNSGLSTSLTPETKERVINFLKIIGDKSLSGGRISAQIGCVDALMSKQPNLVYIVKDSDLADMVGAVFYEGVKDYIEINYSGTNAPLVAGEFT